MIIPFPKPSITNNGYWFRVEIMTKEGRKVLARFWTHNEAYEYIHGYFPWEAGDVR